MTNENEKPKMALWKKIALGFGVVLVIAMLTSDDDKESINNSSNSGEETIAQADETEDVIGIGSTIKTDYFDVTLNKATLTDQVSTGNEFLDPKAEGDLYLVLNVTFKNTDTESRMLEDGIVLINFEGKEYKFDKSETIMADGWGLLLDQINPMLSKTTNLVYKVPATISGIGYYMPGRNSEEVKFSLGEISWEVEPEKK
jgi:hypothetical protein